ncbi:hypothetical protein LCGC14_0737820 [marine sediment metagenome]|uniref:Uncharacterized protein n=1 Tax=marine sediment metagenome TaxID=412755 RepID=A0A0F9SSL0_9ZZZZ
MNQGIFALGIIIFVVVFIFFGLPKMMEESEG